MTKYMLERAEPYIVKTELTKNRTCQTYRWKQVAMSDDLEALKSIMEDYHRIVRLSDLKVMYQTFEW